MIERIFIPTVNRPDTQITYENLPSSLRSRVTMVVQAWERPLYNYSCDYLVLPDTPEYHYTDYYCLSKTRKLIYEAGKNMKYCMLDDDITFGRRNTKYFGMIDNMPMSKRKATNEDVLEMFSLYDKWLDDPDVTVCGCSFNENPPANKIYTNNSSLSSALWINGKDFAHILPDLELTKVRVMEDTCFLMSLLTRGFGNRVSQEFLVYNNSVLQKNLKSELWDNQSFEQTHNDHKIVEAMFPGVVTILYDETGKRIPGGFRNYGKVRIQYSKAYKQSKK